MGLADVMRPQMPPTLSTNIMTETELNERSFDSFVDSTIGTNPETLFIALESMDTEERRREAFAQLINSTSVD